MKKKSEYHFEEFIGQRDVDLSFLKSYGDGYRFRQCWCCDGLIVEATTGNWMELGYHSCTVDGRSRGQPPHGTSFQEWPDLIAKFNNDMLKLFTKFTPVEDLE